MELLFVSNREKQRVSSLVSQEQVARGRSTDAEKIDSADSANKMKQRLLAIFFLLDKRPEGDARKILCERGDQERVR